MSNIQNWVITDFAIRQNYVIHLTFKDGKKQIVDFEPVIGNGWMTRLKDLAYFRRVKLNEGGNLEWPDGQDFNPEALYDWPNFKQAYIDDNKRINSCSTNANNLVTEVSTSYP